MKLLVGLGNPGIQYQGSRHNIGFELVQRIVWKFGLSSGGERFKGLFGNGRIADMAVSWLCPLTFMNLSGESVGAAVRFYKLSADQIVVFHDDMDLALGRVKIKLGGGNGGHNGLKSIHQVMSTPDFFRVRVGIGRPPRAMDPARYVLESFGLEERRILDPTLEKMPDALPFILNGELSSAMNRLAPSP